MLSGYGAGNVWTCSSSTTAPKERFLDDWTNLAGTRRSVPLLICDILLAIYDLGDTAVLDLGVV